MRIKFHIFLIICLLTIGGEVFAQSAETKERISELENEMNNVSGVKQIPIICEIAELYSRNNSAKALSYLETAEKVAKKSKAKPADYILIYDGYASVYYFKKLYKKSSQYYEKVLTLAKQSKNKRSNAYALFNLGISYKAQNLNKKAITSFNASLKLAKSLRDYSLAIQNYHALYETYLAIKEYKPAFENYSLYINNITDNAGKKSKKLTVLTSSYKGEEKMKLLTESEVLDKEAKIEEMDSAFSEISQFKDSLELEAEQKAQEIEHLSKQNEEQSQHLQQRQAEIKGNRETIEKQESLILAFSVVGVIILGLLIVLFTMFKKIKRINNRLETQKDEIEIQKNLIQVKNEQITDSINYARKIQDSILVPENKIKRWLPQMFIYYKPKDIVSGDFYWFSKFEHKYVITAIDCTGHGVPGAFLSMIGNTLLHEIVNIKHVFKPDQILSMLHTGITLALNQESEDSGSEDGMDMSLCTVDTKQHRFQFAGAKNNLYVVQGDKLKILRANYYSIGGKPLRPDMKVEFTCYDFMYDDNTSIYMFSDGYLDQFGGENDEKFNTQRFKEMILANRELPMEQQKKILAETMEAWKGDNQQIDDFLVMGVKLSDLEKGDDKTDE